MNKLILKNPILKFKLGLKVLKALLGTPLAPLPLASPIALTAITGGFAVSPLIAASAPFIPSALATASGYYGYKKLIEEPNTTDKINSGINTVIFSTNPTKKVYRTKNGFLTNARVSNKKKRQTTENPFDVNNPSTWGRSIGTVTVTPRNTTPVAPRYYMPKYQQSVNKQGLHSREDIMAKLRMLKNYYEGNTFKEDGIWGSNTEAAYQNFLKLNNTSNITPVSPVSVNLSIPSHITEKTQQLLSLQTLPQQNTYDRSLTRDWIRTKLGANPYQYSGALRRALRYWLNGDKEGLNYDKNILGVFGDLTRFAKQGGTLISKNPIERFLQGRTLTK